MDLDGFGKEYLASTNLLDNYFQFLQRDLDIVEVCWQV